MTVKKANTQKCALKSLSIIKCTLQYREPGKLPCSREQDRAGEEAQDIRELRKLLALPQVAVIRPKDSFMGWECINGTQLETRTHMDLTTNIYNAEYLYKPLMQPMIITNVGKKRHTLQEDL